MTYLLFSGQCYYPGGGWNDFDSAHSTHEEAKAAVKARGLEEDDYGWWHIVNADTRCVVERGTRS